MVITSIITTVTERGSATIINHCDGDSSSARPIPEGGRAEPGVIGRLIIRLFVTDDKNLVPEVRLQTVRDGAYIELKAQTFAVLDDGSVAMTTVGINAADLANARLWSGVILNDAQRAAYYDAMGRAAGEHASVVEQMFPSFKRAPEPDPEDETSPADSQRRPTTDDAAEQGSANDHAAEAPAERGGAEQDSSEQGAPGDGDPSPA